MIQNILNRNEFFYLPAPRVLKAIKNFNSKNISCYFPGYYQSKLALKLAKNNNVQPDQVLIFYGLEDFFRNIFNTLNPDHDKVLTNQHHFAYFSKYLKFIGVKLIQFKMRESKFDFKFDINDCLIKYRKYKPKILLVASPNNPTGNVLAPNDLKKLLNNVSSKTLFIVDQAYFGFDQTANQNYTKLLRRYPNLILARTFSKFYGLAGLRIGYALAGKKAIKMIKYQQRYLNFSRPLESIAISALDSTAYYRTKARQISRNRDWLISQIRQMGQIKVFDSQTNFVLLKLKPRQIELLKKLLKKQKNIITLFIANNYCRVSITLPSHTKEFVKILKK